MNESSIDLFNCNQIPHVLTFWVLFMDDQNLLQTVFRPLVNQRNDTIALTNSF